MMIHLVLVILAVWFLARLAFGVGFGVVLACTPDTHLEVLEARVNEQLARDEAARVARDAAAEAAYQAMSPAERLAYNVRCSAPVWTRG